MEVTWLGMVLFPLGVLLLIAAPRWLYPITVFSVPFTATSLLNTASGAPVAPINFFGVLFIANQVLVYMTKRRTRNSMGRDKSLYLLILFLGIVLLSMIMPLIIDGDLLVSSNQLNDIYYQPVQLTTRNIWAPFPVVFFVMLTVFWTFKNNTPEKVRSTLKIYIFSALFASLWGGYQFLCDSVLHIEYPYYIFNNAIVDSMKGYDQIININGRDVSRISSITHETSIFSKYLLSAIPIMFVSVLMKCPLFSGRMDKFILFILTLVILMTTSSTAYFGIIVVSVTTIVLFTQFHSVAWRFVASAAIFCGVFYIAYLWFPIVHELIFDILFNKLESGSTLERSLSISNSWEYFLEYPALGVGWGMVTSHDLFVSLLVSTGVIGLVTFVVLIGYVTHRSLRTLDRCSRTDFMQHKNMFTQVAGLTISFITLIVTGTLTGLEFYLGYFYFILSMLIASNVVFAKKVSRADQLSFQHQQSQGQRYQHREIIGSNSDSFE